MKTYSLRLRLLAGAIVAVFAALAIAWGVMVVIFERHLERQITAELQRHALQLLAGLDEKRPDGITLVDTALDPRFHKAASGLYWQIKTGTQTLRSRSLWDQALPSLASASRSDWHKERLPGPFGGNIILLERIVSLDADFGEIRIEVAHDDKGLTVARSEFGRELGLFLLLLWLVLSAAAWIQVYLGLRPLAALHQELKALRRSATARLEGRYPAEVEPLTMSINDLADAREADLKRASHRAADLAHSLKTPLAALTAQSRLVGQAGIPTDGLDRAIASAAAAVEATLARARASRTRANPSSRSSFPGQIARRLTRVLERTEKGMVLDFEIAIPESFHLKIAPDDLNELLGPLLENAVKFARRSVRLRGGEEDALRRYMTIEDDGPGIPSDRLTEAITRGVRLDQTGNGHGLGLSIARDLADATGGHLSLGPSPLGGLMVKLVWPI